jgi:hypothetical protein
MSKQIRPETRIPIPGCLVSLRLSQIGLSKRLLTALRSLRRQFVGDLDGLSTKHLLEADARGCDLIAELADAIQILTTRAQSLNSSPANPGLSHPAARHYYNGKAENRNAQSEVHAAFALQPEALPAAAPVKIGPLLAILEQKLAKLLPRDLTMLKLRFGADGKDPATFDEIAVQAGVSREAVRLVLREKVRLLRHFSGPEFSASLAAVSTFCQQQNCILTPALLSAWLAAAPKSARDAGSSINDQSSAINLRFDLSFHVRLLSEINPDLPAWPSAKTLH